MENRIIKILNDAGYKNVGDNRNYIIRSLNTLLETGMLEIQFITHERVMDGYRYHWEKDGKTYGTAYRFKLFGKWYLGHWMAAKTLYHDPFGGTYTRPNDYTSINLEQVATRIARVMEVIHTGFDSIREGRAECPECGGTGFKPQFSHICHGVCFKCGGSGIDYRALRDYIRNNM